MPTSCLDFKSNKSASFKIGLTGFSRLSRNGIK